MSGNLEEAIGKAEARAQSAITAANSAINALQSFIKPDLGPDGFNPGYGGAFVTPIVPAATSNGADPGPADISALEGLVSMLADLAKTPPTPPPGYTKATKIGKQTTKGAAKIGVQTTKGAAKIGVLTTTGAAKHTLTKTPTVTVRKLPAAPKGPESFTYVEPTSGSDFGDLPKLAVKALNVNTVTGLVAVAPTYDAPTKLTELGVDVTRAKSDLADLVDSVYEDCIAAFEGGLTELVMPTITLTAPEYTALSYTEFTEAQLLERVTRWGDLFTFLDGIRTSGKAIPEGMATKLYGESRDNEVASFRTGLLGVDTNFANRGFKIPQPASINLYEKEADKYTKALSGANRAITNKMMELYTDVVKFSVTAGIDLEKVVADVTDHYIDRLLLAAEKTFNLQIEYYNLKVRLYEAEIKLVKDWVDLQRLILEGKLSRLDIYKVKLAKEASDQKNTELYLEGDKLYLEQKKLLVEEYRAQVEEKKAALSYEGAKIEFDKLKLQQAVTNSENAARKANSDATIGQVQIGAYNAKIAGFEKTSRARVESSEVEIHKHNLEIEVAKVNVQAAALDIEAAKVDVQAAGVDVEAAKVDVQAAGVDVEAAKVNVQAAGVDVEAAKVDVQAAGVDVEAAKADVQAAGVDVEAIKADASVLGADAQFMQARATIASAAVGIAKATVDATAASSQVSLGYADLALKGLISTQHETVVAGVGVMEAQARLDANNAEYVKAEAAKIHAQGEIANNKAQIGLEAAKAAAQIASGMVQGALSAIHVAVGQTSH